MELCNVIDSYIILSAVLYFLGNLFPFNFLVFDRAVIIRWCSHPYKTYIYFLFVSSFIKKFTFRMWHFISHSLQAMMRDDLDFIIVNLEAMDDIWYIRLYEVLLHENFNFMLRILSRFWLHIQNSSSHSKKIRKTVKISTHVFSMCEVTQWCCLPLQSFISTIPNICSCASFTGTGSPSFVGGPPTKNATSNSKSMRRQGPNTGAAPSTGQVWPLGRWIGVPDMTTEDARPWYPTGKCFL